MTILETTQYVPIRQLLTGHFHETSGYRAYRQHGVDDWLLIHTQAGVGRFGHAGGELFAEPGDWVLLRPGTLHDYGVDATAGRWDLVWAHFQPRPDWRPLLHWPEMAPGLMRLNLPEPELANRFIAVHEMLGSDAPRRDLLAMNAFEALLLACDAHNVARAGGDHRVQKATEFIDANFARPLSIADIAAAAALSPSRLAHVFKQETGQTPQHYLETRRMQRAAELLQRTGFSVKQVAATVGFESPFYFSQRFRGWSGKSPSEFRLGL